MSSLEVLFNLDAVNTVALLAVVFIGLPHGAMDGALAVHFGWMKRPSSALALASSLATCALDARRALRASRREEPSR